MKEIKLTKGKIALIDDEDFEIISQGKWTATKNGNTNYAIRQHNKVRIYMHRMIMNPPMGCEIDHIDHNGLNNQKFNLRICYHKQNTRNRGKVKNDCSSKYLGVHFNKKQQRYQAYISTPGKHLFIGSSKNEIDAAKLYDKAARKYFGEFAFLNIPQSEPEQQLKIEI